MDDITAIIAEDERALRIHLRSQLNQAWPELRIVGEAQNGPEALALIARHEPNVAFLDIRMPGLSGLEVARKIPRSCNVVFVTAYDQYAVKAFENEAMDYLLKPVSPERMAKTVTRLKRALTRSDARAPANLKGIERVLLGLEKHRTQTFLKWIRVQHGSGLQLISVEEICYFKSSDKYTTVRTETDEYLIRKPIKALVEELDPQQFWQVHRGAIVNVAYISSVSRSLTGKGSLRLKHIEESLTVSQTHMHRFRQM
jgi:DNA-binding LytR/AlgR family response regulator